MATKITTTKTLDTHNVVSANELERILDMMYSRIETNPEDAKTMAPLLIHGSPGLGKSTVVRTFCERRGLDFIDARLAQMEPCDIKGLPVPNRETNSMDWFINGMWPRDPKGKGIIFLDEVTGADRSVQIAAYELVLDRRLGKMYSVPPGYMIVAAGNNTTDRAVAYAMSSALANRFMHVELEADAESWLEWARSHNIHPAVIGFLMYKPAMLFQMEGQNTERGWPSPRSWERVSQACHMYKDSEDTLLRKMVYGLVGNGAGVEFMEFYKINAEFDNVLDYMRNPKLDVKKIIPDKADRKYALCSTMVYLLWRGKDEAEIKQRINGFYRICMELTSDFAAMALLASFCAKDPEERKYRCKMMLADKLFPKWRVAHGSALKKGLDLSSFA